MEEIRFSRWPKEVVDFLATFIGKEISIMEAGRIRGANRRLLEVTPDYLAFEMGKNEKRYVFAHSVTSFDVKN